MPHRSSASYQQACRKLAGRLQKRSLEIEAAIYTRIREMAPLEQDPDPEYIYGLREAIRSAITYSLTSIEASEASTPPVPLSLLTQARLAARHGVSLGTVMCRYTLGANQLNHFLVAEAKQDPQLLQHLEQLLRERAQLFERVLLELQHEYGREPQHRPDSPDARKANLVKRLLAGEPVDTSPLNYVFDGHHLGVVTQGGNSVPLLQEIAKTIDCRLLIVTPGLESLWAWFGTRHPIDPDRISTPDAPPTTTHIRLGLGEPGMGLHGWSQTHRQAREAFAYALRSEYLAVRYADIALQAAIERDDLASISLHEIYVAPLERHAHGDVLLRTLRAYFAAGRNAAAARIALDVSRQTVSKRLQSIEALLRRPLAGCCPDLELALRIRDFHDRR